MTLIKLKFIVFLFLIAHVCHGQFFYTDYQEGEQWLITHYGTVTQQPQFDTLNVWSNYIASKGQTKQGHSLAIFAHLYKSPKLISIYQKSDLIGDGIIPHYQYKSDNLEIINSMFFTHDRFEAPRGFVRTVKNVTMYTNQAFIKMNNNIKKIKYSVKIGRDFLKIGHGFNASLFISDYSRPFDQITVRTQVNKWSSLFSIVQLDTMNEFNRYLYLHTLNYKQNNFSITLGEGVLESGNGKSISLNYLNPIHLWTWENISGGSQGINGFLYFGFTWFPINGIRVYGETLIDDINFHKKDAFYLNKYGYLFGFQKTGFPMPSSNYRLEISNVQHQVYQSYHPTHSFIHRGYPIGHFLGNDFINLNSHYSQLIFSGKVRSFADASYFLDGANGLYTPFDNPYENYDGVVLDYEPPGHPTPPVTKYLEIELGTELNIYHQTYLTISGQYQSIAGESSPYFNIGVRFWSFLQYPFFNQ